ncbi:hypothetical protein D3C86_2176610 [compost metagenome]
MAQRRLTLNLHKGHVFIDIEQCLSRVDDFKNNHSRNLNRIPLNIVNLKLDAVEVAHPQGYCLTETKGNNCP